jgi:hypothetical protein
MQEFKVGFVAQHLQAAAAVARSSLCRMWIQSRWSFPQKHEPCHFYFEIATSSLSNVQTFG